MDQSQTISISVKLHGSLAKYKPAEETSSKFTLQVFAEMTIKQLLVKLSIPDETIKMISLNDKLVKDTSTLSDGDRLILFSTIAGG